MAWGDNGSAVASRGGCLRQPADHLAGDIQAEPILPSLTVGAFLDKTNSRPRLAELLGKPQPIGRACAGWTSKPARFASDMPAAAVRELLERIAADNPKTSPLTADSLARNLKNWDGRVFSATCAATVGLGAVVLRRT